MSTIFPQIETLQGIPSAHEHYARKIISLINDLVKEEEEMRVGIYEDKGISFLPFSDGEMENVILELRCKGVKFSIVVKEQQDAMNSSMFKYNIPNGEELYESLPENLRLAMEHACMYRKEVVFKTQEPFQEQN